MFLNLICSLALLLASTNALEVDLSAEPAVYGVDCSFPIHREISKADCPYFHAQYERLMDGCAKAYSKEECESNENDRIVMNLEQPPTQHNYTEVGFKQIKAPKAAWEPLINFYNKYKARAKLEKWYRGATIVNSWEAPSYMVSFEDPEFKEGTRVKELIWEGVKPIIEEWVGHKIEPTSLYGIRIYTGGSILATRKSFPHSILKIISLFSYFLDVDRLPLVSSCIINVDQDVDEAWPIEVYDHNGRAYNVSMEPGDLVLYESSTVLHGRPFPMVGRKYANIFVHFKPLDHDDMNEKDEESRRLGGDEPLNIKRRHGGKTQTLVNKGEKARVAAALGDLPLLQKLIAQDASLVHAADENKWQPLHEAIRDGNLEVVKYLISAGSDLKWKVNSGLTALAVARSLLSKNHEVINYLVSIGAPEA